MMSRRRDRRSRRPEASAYAVEFPGGEVELVGIFGRLDVGVGAGEAVAAAAEGIRDGDIIAATSTVAGLDIAHTGIALWEDGRLHLLHAPLVGRSVEISELPLADRIQGIGGQDGIMVGRLQEGG